jgi:hypothetical protein
MKICSKCDNEKELKEFFKDSSHKDGLTSSCKSCYKKYKETTKESRQKWQKEDYNKNKEKVKEKNKIYYENNKEVHNERSKKWMKNNKEYFSNYLKSRSNIQNSINRERYKDEPEYKIKLLLRIRLWELLKRNKSKKLKSAIKLLGCTAEELIIYLEKQFLPEFTWENHGIIWEIDHIIGCINFDLTKLEDQKQCFHYTNLKPIFKTTEIAESFGYKDQIGNRNKKKYE